MERLTEKRDGQNVIPLRQDGKTKWSLCSAGMGDVEREYYLEWLQNEEYGQIEDELTEYLTAE